MYDTGKVLLGIVIFLLVALSPLIYNVADPAPAAVPELKPPPNGAIACLYDKAIMRATHMDKLNEWRDMVVRNGDRIWENSDTGERWPMSLTLTCLQCHSNKEEFCDACHTYLGIDPYCWDCHVAWSPVEAPVEAPAEAPAEEPVETMEVQ